MRHTTGAVRRLFRIAATLVFAIGFSLYVLSGHTDRFFAWTIKVPLTAAFLGALYLASGLAEAAAARTRVWAYSRISAPGVLIFAGLTLVVTLVHRDAFHFGAANPVSARFVAWIWLLVYAAFPVAMAILLIGQHRVPGTDAPRRFRLSGWAKGVLAVQASLMLITGVALLFAPGQAARYWPWPLTVLTAQAIGAWSIGLGSGVAQAIWEDDWLRLGAAAPIYLVFGSLGLVALARYPLVVAWRRPSAWVLVAFLASALLGGVYAAIRVARARSTVDSPVS
jgi:hypothetical protein